MELPFREFDGIKVIIPTLKECSSEELYKELLSLKDLILMDKESFPYELGCEILEENNPRKHVASWYLGPSNLFLNISKKYKKDANQPELRCYPDQGLLFSDGANRFHCMQTLSFIRNLSRLPSKHTIHFPYCKTKEEMVQRVYDEIKFTYPYFKLKNLDWETISKKHIPKVLESKDPIASIQAWLAELDDAHTWLRYNKTLFFPNIDLYVTPESAKVINCKEESTAWKAGVRDGFELQHSKINEWWHRTPSTSHAKPWIVGQRLLASEEQKEVTFHTKDPSNNKIITWNETPQPRSWEPILTYSKDEKEIGYIKISCFIDGLESKLVEALKKLKNCKKLVVDLRNNPGGNIILAYNLKGYFLDSKRCVGYIEKSLPDGSISERREIQCTPKKDFVWKKPVEFQINARSYSATEDFLLGLSEQENMTITGPNSGGGSGRSRVIPFTKDYNLFISTTITYDTNGRCVEGQGIQTTN